MQRQVTSSTTGIRWLSFRLSEVDKLDDLTTFLAAEAQSGTIAWDVQSRAAKRFHLTYTEVEEAILELSLIPLRYRRNGNLITPPDQLRLLKSSVAVIGCGGLGGYIVEETARLGIGRIVVVDPDRFEEHNLNRQPFSTLRTVGMPKVEAAVQRVTEINPVVTVVPVREAFSRINSGVILKDIDVAVDALDTIAARIELAETCDALSIPMVYGTVGGWYGQVATQMPGTGNVWKILKNYPDGEGIEKVAGVPSFGPAVIAGLETAEVCKILLNQGNLLQGRMLFINLLDMEVEEIALPNTK
ncbi:MAG: Molybdopterin-synthase adenylyltransferase [Syntrophorhabdus sp. PtaU1.Bin058]|nr:MAG: Molybdopterin-synthase adenylyltransferase [Syntrophorhabdus sp. PtaU1.Bin058]